MKSGDFEIPSHVSPLARDLIRSLLRKSPKDRLPLDRVLTHPFFSDSAGRDNAFTVSRTQAGRTVPAAAYSAASLQTLGSDGSSGKGSQVISLKNTCCELDMFRSLFSMQIFWVIT